MNHVQPVYKDISAKICEVIEALDRDYVKNDLLEALELATKNFFPFNNTECMLNPFQADITLSKHWFDATKTDLEKTINVKTLLNECRIKEKQIVFICLYPYLYGKTTPTSNQNRYNLEKDDLEKYKNLYFRKEEKILKLTKFQKLTKFLEKYGIWPIWIFPLVSILISLL